jgi:hypothetical protein
VGILWTAPQAGAQDGSREDAALEAFRLPKGAESKLAVVGRKQPEEGLDALPRRVEILRYARHAYREADRSDRAEQLEHAIEYGELLLEGGSDQAKAEALESVPSRDQLIELLEEAAHLYGEWGHSSRADACRALASFYGGGQARERQGRADAPADAHDHADAPPLGDIGQLDHRIEILGFAHEAFVEAGASERVAQMERFLAGAELQRSGASQDELRRAFDGISMESVVRALQQASQLYAQRGWERRSAACHELAAYYAERYDIELGHAPRIEQHDEHASEHAEAGHGAHTDARDLEDRAQRVEILRLAREAHARGGNLEAAEILERTVRLGELQLENADPEAIARAQSGLSMEGIIAAVESASRLWAEAGSEQRAEACARLADFYVRREQGRAPQMRERGGEPSRPPRPEGPDEARVRELTDRLHDLQEQLARLEDELRRLSQGDR